VENAVLNATTDSSATASGGSAFGDGQVIAVNGLIATNLLLSEAPAFVVDSDLTSTAGNILVDARNTSTMDATTLSATTSGDKAVGIVLAFNSMGREAQNLLFNTVDALIGSPEISDAFGAEAPAKVEAYIEDTVVDA